MLVPLIALLTAAPNSQASLILSADSVAPGETVTAAIRIEMDRGWHTYWKNPGDSGSAPTVKWKLPSGWRIGALRWPLPKRHQTPDGTDFIYEKEVLLLADLTAPVAGSRQSLNDSEVAIPVPKQALLQAQVSWLVCQDACMPSSADVKATIRIGGDHATKEADLLAEAAQAIPAKVIEGWKAKATPTGVALLREDGDKIEKGTIFLPSDPGTLDHSDPGTINPDGTILSVRRSPYAKASPKRLKGVIVLPNGNGQEIDLAVSP